jgi:hypothetical protein
MARKSQYISISMLLVLMLAACMLSHSAMGQTTSAQQVPRPKVVLQRRPISLAHLYWHFLVYQNYLDTKAAELGAQGKDTSLMHNHLQKQLGFSDADYVPLRTASVRLAAKVKALDAQTAAVRAAGAYSSNQAQLQDLAVQREADINSEIIYLKDSLSPDKIKAFEAFVTQMFSPNNTVPRPAFADGKQVAAAVQK